MEIFEITIENFNSLNPNALLDINAYHQVEDLVLGMGVGGYNDVSEFATQLAEKLTALGSALPVEIFNQYFFLLKLLKLFGLRNIGDKEKNIFFKDEILDLFKTDAINVQEEVEKVFRAYFDAPDIKKNLRTLFLTGFEKNTESLGDGNIKVTVNGEEKVVKPTIQNWILDYESLVHVNPETGKRSGYEQASFITRSPNALRLKKDERDLLLKIVQFYDWLKFDPLQFDFRLPGQAQWHDEILNIDKPERLIPDDLIEIVEDVRKSNQVNKKTSGTEESYMVSQKFALPKGLSPSEGKIGFTEKKPFPVVPRPTNIQDILSKRPEQQFSTGLRMGDGVTEQRPAKPIVPDIDKKLEELKKRTHKS